MQSPPWSRRYRTSAPWPLTATNTAAISEAPAASRYGCQCGRLSKRALLTVGETSAPIFDISFRGLWRTEGVMDHAARTSRKVFRELAPCVSPWNSTFCHSELVMGARYRCGYNG